MQKDNCGLANKGEWSNGPSLLEGRSHHAAGIVTDEVTNENFVVVTGSEHLKSTEILKDGKWVQGKLNSYLKLSTYTNSFFNATFGPRIEKLMLTEFRVNQVKGNQLINMKKCVIVMEFLFHSTC